MAEPNAKATELDGMRWSFVALALGSAILAATSRGGRGPPPTPGQSCLFALFVTFVVKSL